MALAVFFALFAQFSVGMIPVALATDPTTIVEWNFNDENTTVDVGTGTLSTATNVSGITFVGDAGSGKAATATGWDGGVGTKYWQVEFATTGYDTLKLSSKQRGSSTGPKDFKVEYSIDSGANWGSVPLSTITATTDWSITGSGGGTLANVELPSACDNQTNVYLRWVMTSNDSIGGGTVGSDGTNLIDDIVVMGTPVAAVDSSNLYVDDEDCSTGEGAGTEANPFCTIQEAITAVDAGGTINVAAGTYDEVGQIVIDKNMSILGEAKATTIVTPDHDTNSSNYTDTSGWFFVQPDKSFTLKNVTLDGTGRTVNAAIQSRGNVIVEDCAIKNIYAYQYMGFGIQLLSGELNEITGCEFTDIERIGIHVRGNKGGTTEPIAAITDCTYTGRGAGDFLEYGIEFGGGGSGAVDNFTVSNNLGTESGWGSAGILATDLYGAPTVATISNSYFLNNNDGIMLGYNDDDLTELIVTNTVFDGNIDHGIQAKAAVTLTATNNYWGAITGPASCSSGDQVSANVDYSPWSIDDGFTATRDHNTSNGHDCIQSAIDAASDGDTIEVLSGTFVEEVVIDKPLTLRGATYLTNKNGATVPASYAWSGETVIQNPDSNDIATVVDIVSDDVIFEGFVVQSLNRPTNNWGNLLRLDASTGTAHDGAVVDTSLDNILIRNNFIGPNTNITSQDGTKGRMGLYFASPFNSIDETGITNTIVSGNKIIDAKGNGNNVFIWGSATNYLSTGRADYSGTIIEDNEISGSHRTGIEIAGGVDGLTIRNNNIHSNSSESGGGSADSNLKYGNGILIIRMGSDKTDPTAWGATNLTISDNNIHDNEKNAIYFGPINSNHILEDNDIQNNGWDGIRIDLNEEYHGGVNPVFDKISSIKANWNTISSNTQLDANVLGTPTNSFVLDAEYNNWGSAAEPSDKVEGGVDYTPWLTGDPDTVASTLPSTPLVKDVPLVDPVAGIGSIALDTAGDLSVVKYSGTPPDDPADSGFSFAGSYYDIDTDLADGSFTATIVFEYTEDAGNSGLVNGVPEEDLRVAYFDGTKWVMIPGDLDTDANTYTFTTTHFTAFTLVGTQMDVVANDITPTTAQSGTDNLGILDLVFTNSTGSADTLTDLVITSKNADDGDVVQVELFTGSVGGTSVGTATFSSGTATFSGLGVSIPTGASSVFVAFDLNDTLDSGNVLDASIPENGVTLTNSGTNIEILDPDGETKIDDDAPTVVLGDSDDDYLYAEDGKTKDGLVKSGDTITFTAEFNEAMTIAPQISVASIPCDSVVDATMTGSGSSWNYSWFVPTCSDSTDPTINITVSGSDLAGNLYNDTVGTDTLHFIYDNTPPTIEVEEGVDVGPTKTDTINIFVKDGIGNPDNSYDFSDDTICDASDFTAPISFTSEVDFEISGTHTDYLCARAIDDAGHISYLYVGQLNTDNTTPMIIGESLAGNNSYFDVNFDEGIFGPSGAAAALEDLKLTFTQNSGTATDAAISSISKTDNAELVGGETAIRANLSITGTPDGSETIAILPTDGSSLYDIAGNAMDSGESTGVISLNDQLAPTITSVTASNADGAYGASETIDIDVVFSEQVTSTGVTVTLETGTTDQQCIFTISNSDFGSCNYVVQAGDTSADLDTISIEGTIADGDANEMIDFTPATSLATNKNIIIDTTTPDINSVDAGADSTDRSSLTSGTWFKADAIDDDDLVSFSWTDANSLSSDLYYYELNADSADTITGGESESTTADNFVDLIAITEGTNYFHVRPQNGTETWGTERIFEVKYDTTDPTTSAAVTAGTLGNDSWYTTDVTVTITPADATSGAASTVYCTDTSNECTPETSYTVALTISTDGTNYIRYFSTDNAGNVQATQILTIKLDKTDPVSGSVAHTDGYENDTTIAVTVDRGTDATSGTSEDNDDYLLEYHSATLTDDTCGDYGSWTDTGVTETAAATDYDFTSTSGNCYQFRYTIEDMAGNSMTYTSDDTTKVDTVAPTAPTFSPLDNATGVAVDTNLTLTFSENMKAGVGDILVKKSSDDSTLATIPADDAQISFEDDVVTINPIADLSEATSYYFEIAAGALTDLAGNSYAGFTDKSAWNFTTVPGANVENTLIFEPGWNVFSTPRLLESINFSNGGTNLSFYKLEGGQWNDTTTPATTANIQPLEGFLVNNASGDNIYVYLDYKAELTAGQKLFTDTLDAGWNIVGVADLDFAANDLNYTETAIDSAFDSLLGSFAQIIDYTTEDFGGNDSNNGVEDKYLQINSTDTSERYFEEFKAYPVFIRQGGGAYGGSQQ